MALLIVIAGMFALLFLSVLAAVQVIFEKVFKISQPGFLRALRTVVCSQIVMVVVTLLIDYRIVHELLVLVLGLAAGFFVFRWFHKRDYGVSWSKSLAVYAASLIVTLTIISGFIISLRTYVVQPFVVEGGGMLPTYPENEYLLINEFDETPERGEVAVYHFEGAPEYYYIKRVIGLPNEIVEIRGGKVYVNDVSLEEPYIFQETRPEMKVVLGPDEYFLLGDNRADSLDSRDQGPVSADTIDGTVMLRVMNLSDI